MSKTEPPARPDLSMGREPEAVVEPLGGNRYRIYIEHGILRWGGNDGYGWVKWGEARARDKATRELAKYKEMKAREAANQAGIWRTR